ncbi:hypothetical protein FRC00_007677 [Tulasnella sp. 408]|nr:hypothetical protein FRC00_007677 [Tulasnella sp. 408]
MADPTTQHPMPDTTDLEIRSISSLLYHLWPYTRDTFQADSTNNLAFLNNIALLFVSGARNDCAAVATFVHKDNIHVEAIKEPPYEPEPAQWQVFRNVKMSVLQQKHDEATLEALEKELLHDPILFCLKKGLDAITPELHGKVLEDLLQKMYQVDADDSQKGAMNTLSSYIVCFGIRKIRRRLNIKINNSMLPHVDLLTSSNISKEEFITTQTNVKVKLPQKLENADERWLKQALELNYHGMRVDFVQKGKDSIHLCLTKDQEWNLWELFKTHLETLQTLTPIVDQLTGGNKSLQRPDENPPLDYPFQIFKSLWTLHLLTNDSPTFWTIMEQKKELISSVSRHLRGGFNMEQDLHNSPPTLVPPQENRETLQQPGEGDAEVESSDADTDYSAWQDTRFEDNEVRSGQQTPQPRGPSHSAAARHMQHEGPEQGLSSSIREIRRWLVLLTEWYQAFRHLSKSSVATGFRNKSLTIHVELAPQPLAPNRQASLRSIVDSLSFNADSDTKLNLIIARAQTKFPNHNRNAQDAISVLLNASPENKETLQGWETKFNGTSVHCEALLACNLKAQNATQMSIGISKRCCFCCATVLQHLGFKGKHIGGHGKVYPWSPPPGADVDTKGAVLQSLKAQLSDCLQSQYEGHRTGDSGPISSKGSPRADERISSMNDFVVASKDYLITAKERFTV